MNQLSARFRSPLNLMEEVNLKISQDEAIVLFEFFERFGDKGRLFFVHPAEYISLMRISAQIDRSTSIMFSGKYAKLLREARERVAEGFESDYPEIEKE